MDVFAICVFACVHIHVCEEHSHICHLSSLCVDMTAHKLTAADGLSSCLPTCSHTHTHTHTHIPAVAAASPSLDDFAEWVAAGGTQVKRGKPPKSATLDLCGICHDITNHSH